MREGIKWIGFRSVTRFHEAVGADRKRRKTPTNAEIESVIDQQ